MRFSKNLIWSFILFKMIESFLKSEMKKSSIFKNLSVMFRVLIRKKCLRLLSKTLLNNIPLKVLYWSLVRVCLSVLRQPYLHLNYVLMLN